MPHRKLNVPAKISAPFIDRYVVREALYELLDNSRLRKKVSWIAAPGGAGKTMLTKGFLDSKKIHPLWYQVDSRDADPATIFHYLAQAAAVAAGNKYKLLPALTPEYLSNLPSFSANYFESLFAQLSKPFVMVFDNCQDISAISPFFSILRAAVEQLPNGGHILCLSREKPPAEFAALRAKQLMTLIEENQLRFSIDEISQLAELSGNARVTEEDVEKLRNKTLGWAAGLVLLLDDPELLNADDSHVLTSGSNLLFDYFFNEFFNQWDEEMRHFLLKTAMLPRVSATAAQALTGNPEAGEILAGLEKRNFFTILYSNRPRIYQYHPLFREFLLAHAHEYFDRKETNSLRSHAASLLMEEKYLEDAIALFALVEDWESLGKAILQNAKLLITKGRFKTLSQWIEAVPEEVLKTQPWLVYWHGVSVQPFNPTEAYGRYEQAFDLFKQQGDKLGMLLGWVALPDAVTFSLGNYHIFDDWLQRFDESIGADYQIANDDIDARLTKSMLNIFSFRSVERKVLDYWIERGEALLNRTLDVNLRMLLGSRLLHTYFNLGLLSEERRVFERVDTLQGSDSNILPVNKILWMVYRSLYGWTSHNPALTCESVANGIEIAENSGIHALDGVLYCIGALHSAANGDANSTKVYLDKVSPTIPFSSPLHLTMYYLALGTKAILEGNHAEAVAATQKSVDTMRKNGGLYPQIHCQIVLAHALLEQGNVEKAHENVAELKALNHRHESEVTTFQILIFEAYAAMRRGDNDCLLKKLKEALELLSHRELTIYHCGFRRDVFAQLCSVALSHDIHADTVCHLIRRYELTAPETADHNWPWPCRITALGRFEIVINDEAIDLKNIKAKPLAILQSIVAFGGINVPEEKITEAIWPDADGDAAHSAFSTTMHRLRKALGRDDLIIVQNRKISFDQQLVWVDAMYLSKLSKVLEGELTAAEYQRHSERFHQLYGGNLLEQYNDSWILNQREKLRLCFQRHTQQIADHWRTTQHWQKVVDTFQRGLEADPLAETFYQGLMHAYRAMGATSEAISTYHRCKQILRRELSIAPSPQTELIFKNLEQVS